MRLVVTSCYWCLIIIRVVLANYCNISNPAEAVSGRISVKEVLRVIFTARSVHYTTLQTEQTEKDYRISI